MKIKSEIHRDIILIIHHLINLSGYNLSGKGRQESVHNLYTLLIFKRIEFLEIDRGLIIIKFNNSFV